MKKNFYRFAAAAIVAMLMFSLIGCSGTSAPASATPEGSSKTETSQTEPKPAEPSAEDESNEDAKEESATEPDEIRNTQPVDIGQLPHEDGDQYVLVKITALPTLNRSDQELNSGSRVTFEYDEEGNPISKYRYYDETNQGLEQEYEYTDGTLTGYTQYSLDGSFAYRVEYGELQPIDHPQYAYMRVSNKYTANGEKDGRIEERLDSNLTVLDSQGYDYLGRKSTVGTFFYLPSDERDIQYDSLGNLLTCMVTFDAGRGTQYTTYIFEYQWLNNYLQNK